VAAFGKNKLLEIDPVGEKFDPNRHQAISTVPVAATNPPVAANHVVAVLQKGYLIHDRVLRPALVTVAQG
jgi:molecular chaperone GrpE